MEIGRYLQMALRVQSLWKAQVMLFSDLADWQRDQMDHFMWLILRLAEYGE